MSTQHLLSSRRQRPVMCLRRWKSGGLEGRFDPGHAVSGPEVVNAMAGWSAVRADVRASLPSDRYPRAAGQRIIPIALYFCNVDQRVFAQP